MPKRSKKESESGSEKNRDAQAKSAQEKDNLKR